MRNAVLDVAGELGIAADGHDAVDGNGNLMLPERGIGGIAGDGRSIGIGEVELGALGMKAYGVAERMSKPRSSCSPPG